MIMYDDTEQCSVSIRTLENNIIDLGVFAEESFKNAISLLFTRDWSSAYTIFSLEPEVSPVTLVSEAVAINRKWALPQDTLNIVLSLHQIALEYDFILKSIQRIAEMANRLDTDADEFFQKNMAAQQAFFRIIQSAYYHLRGCFIALTLKEPDIINSVIQQDAVLDGAYFTAQTELQNMLKEQISLTLPISAYSIIITDIEDIGNHITRICQAMLFSQEELRFHAI